MTKDKKARAQELAEKLARHAKSAEKIGNAEEAAAFMARVTELMDKYGFEKPSGEHEDDLYETIAFSESRYYEDRFMFSLARLYGCDTIKTGKKQNHNLITEEKAYVILYGKRANLDMVIHLYHESKKVLQNACKQALAEYRRNRDNFEKSLKSDGYYSESSIRRKVKIEYVPDYRFKIDFYTGVGRGIEERVAEARESYAKDMNAIVLSEFHKTREALRNQYNVSILKAKIHSKDAFRSGKSAADKVSAGRGLDERRLLH